MNEQFFWKQYEDLPGGIGYGRFSMEHWLTLAVLTALIICIALWFRKKSDSGRGRMMTAVPFLMVALECCKDIFLIKGGRFDIGYLPLHLCGLGMFVFLLHVLSGTEKWKGVFGEISVTLILPGAIAALLFPDWAHLYPVWNFMNLYGYLWHGLLIVFPIFCLIQRQVSLSIRHIHYDFFFLLASALPVYVFDRIFHCNYMFLIHPPGGTPLDWIEALTGPDWYLAGYAVFSGLVITLIYLLILAVRAIR